MWLIKKPRVEVSRLLLLKPNETEGAPQGGLKTRFSVSRLSLHPSHCLTVKLNAGKYVKNEV